MKKAEERADEKKTIRGASGGAGGDGYAGAEHLACLAERLPLWYENNKRDLPWRGTGDPYDVWISEIMLQQTRVAAVMEYYRRFKKELPGAAALAACDDERLMKLWQGLGYYSRARNLKRTAVILMEQYGGCLPRDCGELMRLPGVGSYTAGAIASIAYGLPCPAVDGNVMRVCARVCGNCSDIALPETKRSLERALRDLLTGTGCHTGKAQSAEETGGYPVPDPGVFNQSVMELGALVCVPNGQPLCGECPLRDVCAAANQNMTDRLPVKKPKKARKIERKTILLIRSGRRFLIRRRPGRGLLAGLWEFPSAEGFLTEEEALDAVKEIGRGREGCVFPGWASEPLFIKKLPPAKHVFTHIEWHMEGYEVLLGEEIFSPGDGDMLFAAPEEIAETYSLPSAFSAYSQIVLN